MIDPSREYIYCAATWFKEQPTAHFLPDNIDKWVVIGGINHTQILHTANALLGNVQFQQGKQEYGFLTSTNRFVDRIEACIIAKSQNQLNRYYDGDEKLYSEFIQTLNKKENPLT